MRRRRWPRRVALIAGLGLLLGGGGFAVWYVRASSAFNKIDIVDPGAAGRRIHEDGVFANYYPAAAPGRHPAVLLLGGSEGGIGKGTDYVAKKIQQEGFSVLAPAYFGAPGQPRHLVLVPLETFDHALEWLRARPEVDPNRLVIAGVSKGAEAALLVATRHPELRAVVAGVPRASFGRASSSAVSRRRRHGPSADVRFRSFPMDPFGSACSPVTSAPCIETG